MVIAGILNPFDQTQMFLDGMLQGAIPGMVTSHAPILDMILKVGRFPSMAEVKTAMRYSNPPTVESTASVSAANGASFTPGGFQVSQKLLDDAFADASSKVAPLTRALCFGVVLFGCKKYKPKDFDEAKLRTEWTT